MKLLELVLHNYTVFNGRHQIDLSSASPSSPIILFGGLNGAGKTSILDGIKLALYGIRAKCSKRGDVSYDEFLLQNINRGARRSDGAAVELEFVVPTPNGHRTFRVQRSWLPLKSGVRERVEVLLDGVLDATLTEEWAERVEELLPLGISDLFFFDGDRIEDFADLQSSQDLLHSALQNLLGLNLVDQLDADLQVLEQRKAREETSNSEALSALAELDAAYQNLSIQAQTVNAERARVLMDLDASEKALAASERRFLRAGGSLLEQRKELEAKAQQLRLRAQSSEERLRYVAAGPGPLLLVTDLLRSVVDEDHFDRDRERAALLKSVLEERDQWLVRLIGSRADAALCNEVQARLDEDRTTRTSRANEPCVFALRPEARQQLAQVVDEGADELRRELKSAVEEWEGFVRLSDEADRRANSIPDEDSLASLIHERAAVQAKHAQLKAELHQFEQRAADLQRERERNTVERQKLAHRLVAEDEAREGARRTVEASRAAREHLKEFKKRVMERHIGRIKNVVMDSFLELLRKDGLVGGLEIDSETLELQLFARDGSRLHPNQLSAGERQVLAVSLLWGMAKASGRSLPTVIDTPLGRLDSVHRQHLVQRYFPNASHQVLLLSTDEEINEAHIEALRGEIAAFYHLQYDDQKESTSVSEGYLFDYVEACA
jgi:DNA sulfur modification protein DndD